tara:strand:- start:3121 stop:3588 length:468 start_codon:yes stop_codon:yes gene_type:complete
MKKAFAILSISIFAFLLNSCNEIHSAHIQGVYELDKEAFKAGIRANIEEENEFLEELLDMAVNQATIELQIKNDSIKGILFMMDEVNVLESKISMRNDSLIVMDGDLEAYLFETESGLSFRSPDSEITLELLKTEQSELSEDAKAMMIDKKNSTN